MIRNAFTPPPSPLPENRGHPSFCAFCRRPHGCLRQISPGRTSSGLPDSRWEIPPANPAFAHRDARRSGSAGMLHGALAAPRCCRHPPALAGIRLQHEGRAGRLFSGAARRVSAGCAAMAPVVRHFGARPDFHHPPRQTSPPTKSTSHVLLPLPRPALHHRGCPVCRRPLRRHHVPRRYPQGHQNLRQTTGRRQSRHGWFPADRSGDLRCGDRTHDGVEVCQLPRAREAERRTPTPHPRSHDQGGGERKTGDYSRQIRAERVRPPHSPPRQP